MSPPHAPLKHFYGASRFHIVLIAALGTLAFGWLFTGHQHVGLALLAALDWWILDIGNKLSDLPEDRINNPSEAAWVERNHRLLAGLCIGSFALSAWATAFGRSAWWGLGDPLLLGWRLLFQLVGIAYNFPVLAGGRRFKAMFFWKNTMAGILFLMSVVGYPLLGLRDAIAVGGLYVALLAAFFFFLEHSFEILYDFKDVRGDAAQGVHTYPVVVGERGATLIFFGCLALSAGALGLGLGLRVLGFREGLLLLAPASQSLVFFIYRRHGYPRRGSVLATHVGSAQLLIYNGYVWLGLPIPPW